MARQSFLLTCVAAAFSVAGCGVPGVYPPEFESRPVMINANGSYGLTISTPMCAGDENFSIGIGTTAGPTDPGVDYERVETDPIDEVIVLDVSVETLLARDLTDQLPLAQWSQPYGSDLATIDDAGWFYVDAGRVHESFTMSDVPELDDGPLMYGLAPEDGYEPTTLEDGLALLAGWCEQA